MAGGKGGEEEDESKENQGGMAVGKYGGKVGK